MKKFLLLCLLVLMGSGRSMGCLEEEKNALLKIKAAFNHPNGSSLPSWQGKDGDCCSWDRVECDNATSRVIELDLGFVRFGELPWVINASLFLPLEELQVLDLSGNSLSDLNGTLYLKKLKRLNLHTNDLQRVAALYRQTLVETQNLSSSHLEGVNLEVLDLSWNELVNDALMDIMRITSLMALDIRFCGLDAPSKSLEGLCGLTNLEDLYIGGNEIWGALPSCFCNLTSLRVLEVSNNHLSGAIPSCLLHNLKSLEFIVLSGNAFEGSLSLASLANNSNLEVFRLVDNRNRLEVNTEEPSWLPPFQLKEFGLSNCVLNKDANGVIPSFLKQQHDLRSVRLSQSGLGGHFPSWLLDNNVNLQLFDLRGNNLSGAFHLPNLSLVDMQWFDVSGNIIYGELPSWIGSVLPNLVYLNLSHSLFEGGIPSSMGNLEKLDMLDLSNNNFTGEIPETLATDCTSLFILKLSGNNLQGQMLPRYTNWSKLSYLHLDNNRFAGDISPSILNMSSLRVLDVSNNSLSGTLPNRIGDLEQLEILTLSSNLLTGPLPLSFCNLRHLVILDLSSNNIGPNIPHCANVTLMRYLHLSNDKLVGHFPEFLLGALLIVTLDVRHNTLLGEVPSWIGSLRNLQVLLLQGNNFEGSIPLDLCLLKNMSILDLSNNSLSRQIPSCLKDLTFGNHRVPMDAFATLDIWQWSWASDNYNDRFGMKDYSNLNTPIGMAEIEVINFMTKSRLESYKGSILQLMSGMDLSQNNLTGFIPPEFGQLSELRALNLSHNHLTGLIPEMFSNLKNIESLDLSNNSLIGPIPPQLTELYALSHFSVAHNNLSGRIPDRKFQFGTFDKASYEGNPLLCGAPLTSCDNSNQVQGTPPSFNHTREDDSWREAFLWSFAGSYVVAFLGVVLFLYLHPYYRYMLFELVRKLIPSFP